MENAYNANAPKETTTNNEAKNNVYLNVKTKTTNGEIRQYSFLLCAVGSGLVQSNAKAVIETAVGKAENKGLEEANRYLKRVFVDAVIDSELSLSGVKKASKDWADDY